MNRQPCPLTSDHLHLLRRAAQRKDKFLLSQTGSDGTGAFPVATLASFNPAVDIDWIARYVARQQLLVRE